MFYLFLPIYARENIVYKRKSIKNVKFVSERKINYGKNSFKIMLKDN